MIMEDHFKDILIIIILQLIRIFRSMVTPYNIKRRNRKKRMKQIEPTEKVDKDYCKGRQ